MKKKLKIEKGNIKEKRKKLGDLAATWAGPEGAQGAMGQVLASIRKY